MTRDTTKSVFQYVGVMKTPKQIALRNASRRVTYHIYDGRVRFDEGPWREPDGLDARERRDFLQVVRTWERMRLAQDKRRSAMPN